LAVAWADTSFAVAARTGALKAHASYGTGKNVWFLGHWGFQYYMQKAGGKPVDAEQFRPTVGDVVVVPETNTNLFSLPEWPVLGVLEIPTARWISTMNFQLGAGFYADVFGPLPFAIGPVPPERFTILEVAP
jgi:hypothetical protein